MRIPIYAAAAALAACSSATVTVRPAPLWPFQQLQITSAGQVPVSAYYSAAESITEGLVVVIQDAPCPPGDFDPRAPRISTRGILWKQLRSNFAFVELEAAAAAAETCMRRDADSAWTTNLQRDLTAVRRHENLGDVASLYIGIGAGARTAAALAARDARASALVLLNAANLHYRFDTLLRELRRRQSSRPISILIAHAGSDDRAPVEGAALLFSELPTRNDRVRMLVLRGLGHDLGLGSDRPECFDAAIQQIVSRLRRMIGDDAVSSSQVEQSDCEAALAEFPDRGGNDP